jgi:hypothetical protein
VEETVEDRNSRNSWATGRNDPGWTSERSSWRLVAGSSGKSRRCAVVARSTDGVPVRSVDTQVSGTMDIVPFRDADSGGR